MIGLPGPEHLLFIPAVLLIGITIGYLIMTVPLSLVLDFVEKRRR